jgi:hypothetical protein
MRVDAEVLLKLEYRFGQSNELSMSGVRLRLNKKRMMNVQPVRKLLYCGAHTFNNHNNLRGAMKNLINIEGACVLLMRWTVRIWSINSLSIDMTI